MQNVIAVHEKIAASHEKFAASHEMFLNMCAVALPRPPAEALSRAAPRAFPPPEPRVYKRPANALPRGDQRDGRVQPATMGVAARALRRCAYSSAPDDIRRTAPCSSGRAPGVRRPMRAHTALRGAARAAFPSGVASPPRHVAAHLGGPHGRPARSVPAWCCRMRLFQRNPTRRAPPGAPRPERPARSAPPGAPHMTRPAQQAHTR
ncbi:MAG: hypothetical protein BJ554DRAFT_1177 [Olpidium bornovanus]|uniref:Uncharacterized protein n=1 Tax=Olpidium bornovanus TaxID=278681 RepID=A0A8H8DI00_9FUNG|nr:MAG: hypothetical protein BJ554DRAFT_1177 [Olpidium bornovanus]